MARILFCETFCESIRLQPLSKSPKMCTFIQTMQINLFLTLFDVVLAGIVYGTAVSCWNCLLQKAIRFMWKVQWFVVRRLEHRSVFWKNISNLKNNSCFSFQIPVRSHSVREPPEHRRISNSIWISSFRFLSDRWVEFTGWESWTSCLRWANTAWSIQDWILEGCSMPKGK